MVVGTRTSNKCGGLHMIGMYGEENEPQSDKAFNTSWGKRKPRGIRKTHASQAPRVAQASRRDKMRGLGQVLEGKRNRQPVSKMSGLLLGDSALKEIVATTRGKTFANWARCVAEDGVSENEVEVEVEVEAEVAAEAEDDNVVKGGVDLNDLDDLVDLAASFPVDPTND